MQQIRLMSKLGLALIAITATSIIAVVAVQASYYYIQAADAQQVEQEEEEQQPTEEIEDTDEVEQLEEQDIEDDATITSEDNNNAERTVPSQQQGGGVGTGPRLPNDSVRSENIVDGEVQTQDLADDAVTTEKIRDGEVKADDLDPSIEIGGGAVELETVLRSNSITIQPGQSRAVNVLCQEEETATGGGFETPFFDDVQVTSSVPHEPSAGPGWLVDGKNNGSNESRLTAHVLCAKIVIE